MRNVPNGYWQNDEHVLEAMRTCSSREEFKKRYSAAYQYAQKHKELFAKGNLPLARIYWTYESVMAKVREYTVLEDFCKDWNGAFHYAKRNGFAEEIRSILKVVYPADYDKCKSIGLKYQRRTDWQHDKEDSKYYQQATIHGWLDECCAHMDKSKVYTNKTTWNDELVREVASKCATRKEFINNHGGAYAYACKHKMLDEILAHIPRKGDKYHRCIYAAEFSDNCVYVGLTKNYEKRISDHLKDESSAVYKHIVKTNLHPVFKKVQDYMPVKEAQEMEGSTLQDYIDKGWIPLNVVKTGGTGGFYDYVSPKHTLKEMIDIAGKYSSVTEFAKKDNKLYEYARHHGWMDKLGLPYAVHKPYTYEEILEKASQYNTINDFVKEYQTMYASARRQGFWEEIKAKFFTVSYREWTKADIPEIKKAAKKYKRRRHFQLAEPSMYSAARRFGILNEVCAHMPKRVCHVHNANKEYSLEYVKGVAKKYRTIHKFQTECKLLYEYACNKGWREQLGLRDFKPVSHTFEEILEVASGYEKAVDFETKHNSLYCYARNHGMWGKIKEMCFKPTCRYYTEADIPEITETAKLYDRRWKFQRANSGMYYAAIRFGILDDICDHMPKNDRER